MQVSNLMVPMKASIGSLLVERIFALNYHFQNFGLEFLTLEPWCVSLDMRFTGKDRWNMQLEKVLLGNPHRERPSECLLGMLANSVHSKLGIQLKLGM
jgi:hypothetical protein